MSFDDMDLLHKLDGPDQWWFAPLIWAGAYAAIALVLGYGRVGSTVRSQTMKHFAVAIIVLLIPATALAAGECRKDRHKFCQSETHIRA